MAPVSAEPDIRYVPLLVVVTHFISVVVLATIVGRSLFLSYVSLPPTQATRARSERRSTLIPLFASLLAVSLAIAVYEASSYAVLSYKVWADQRAVDVPIRLCSEDNALLGNNATPSHIARWLTDTALYIDAYEVLAEQAGRFFWGQQIELATISWSLLLSIEGRRRKISSLWAYLALAHLVSLPFAQNLFYIALLLTPTPMPAREDSGYLDSAFRRVYSRIFPPKPINWMPHPALFLVPLTQSFGVVFCLPWIAGTSSFATAVLLNKALSFAPLVVPAVAPLNWGKVYDHPHSAYSALTDLFRFVSTATFLLHAKATALALLHNAPHTHFHRHSKLLPFDMGKRRISERTSTAFAKVLGSMFDHPMVTGVVWDVLLSGVSLIVWASIRPLDVIDVLAVATPFFKSTILERHHEEPCAYDDADISNSPGGADQPDGPASSTRSRTRLGTSSTSPKASSRSSRGSARRKKAQLEEMEYVPGPENRMVVEGDVQPDEDVDWEAAGLTWGLAYLGGLGFSSAAVFGAECISR
ncbi:hypothetical protein SODALDRAFT_54938 [Sodiomyces alkalinus F11]|uniref:Uncharacterized protein n=1 Tax=Sodiomyces alkalinus (strain CBS 110278 / VKM F-3762 / F11) TaxID=1314773 RepID=A0A3N2PN48_SODAK|nr:hypothetical protein SODALDRAFT_54938 [Sodiomyces alkalinus F11]ROT35948.1 hypothetical protein SODALDRAFT_54938 [Sodiomyces alkalinus F11]